MTTKQDKLKLSHTQILFLFLLLSGFGVLMMQYYMRAQEGLAHFKDAELKIISPNLLTGEKDSKKVPNFELFDRGNRKIKLSQFDTVDVLVVNIWSAGCPVCREEIPSLAEFDRRLASVNGVELLTIAVAEDWQEVASYFPKGTNLRVLFDKDDSVGAGIFKTKKYPETFILDQQRRIRARFDGPRPWHSDTFIHFIKSYL